MVDFDGGNGDTRDLGFLYVLGWILDLDLLEVWICVAMMFFYSFYMSSLDLYCPELMRVIVMHDF